MNKFIDNTNIYIMSLEARNIVKNGCKYTVAKKKKNREYNGSLPNCLDLIYLKESYPKSISIFGDKSRQYTDALVNVCFKYPLRKETKETVYEHIVGVNGDIVKTKKHDKKYGDVLCPKALLREILYRDGFTINDKKYVLYKRSSSKARIGQVLFIEEKMYKPMISWSRMDKLLYNEGDSCPDLPSLKAYEALTLSGIENLITIEPHEILFIKDFYRKFKSSASVTRVVDTEIVTGDEEIEISNNLFDGQSLLDSSIFETYSFSLGKGMMLLRNRFFKTCAFNTRLQDWFNDYTSRTGCTSIKDELTGEEKLFCDIKLVTTPSSLKILKFADNIFKNEDTKLNKKLCVEYWLKVISNQQKQSNQFGVCKSEKASPFENGNQLTYQFINSLPLSRKDIKELMEQEVEYLRKLNNDPETFKQHIKCGSPNISKSLVYNLLCINSDIDKTQLYKDYRANIVYNYKKRLMKGKIRVPDTDYAVIFGNAYEMLLRAVSEPITDTLHHGRELYCNKYNDDVNLIGFRNPHVASGNVLIVKNKYHDQFKWFNLTGNIVIVNAYDNDLPDRLQGCDYDSDTMMLSSNTLLVEKGRECQSFLTPINRIDTKKEIYIYSPDSHAKIDNAIADNIIGPIINLSQVFNSYLWNYLYKKVGDKEWYGNNYEDEHVKKLYNTISKLSSLSQLEIDKAKKYFEFTKKKIRSNSLKGKLAQIYKIEYQGEKILQKSTIPIRRKSIFSSEAQLDKVTDEQLFINKVKMIKPVFFSKCSKDKNCEFRKQNTPMEFLIDEIDKIPKAKRTPSIPLNDILNYMDKLDNADRHKIQKLKILATKYKFAENAIYKIKSNDEQEEAYKKFKIEEEIFIDEANKLIKNISVATVITVLLRCYSAPRPGKKDMNIKNVKLHLLRLLYASCPDIFIKCFKEKLPIDEKYNNSETRVINANSYTII